MSYQNQATHETTHLLGDSRRAGQSCKSLSRAPFKLSAETLLVPIALTTKLAALIPSTTFIDLVRRVVCKFWNISHGNSTTFPSGGSIPLELCNGPEIERYFSTVVATLAVVEGILSMAECSLLSRISSHYGRRPALLLVLVAGTVGNLLIPGSQYMPDWLADWVLLAGTLLTMLSGPFSHSYLINMYIVDVSTPEDRTAALSKMGGWTALGTCIPYALGGSITMKTGNPLIVFYVAAAIFFVTWIYAVSVLPESFSEEKRNALSRMHHESSTGGLLAASLLIFEPLKTLIPTRKSDGTYNWRLAWCAAHDLVFATATSYASSAWLVLVTSKYGLTPADTGLFLTIIALSGTIVLAFIVPPLVRLLRPYYIQRIPHPLSTGEDMGHGKVKSEISDRLDVHLAVVSCVVAAVFYLTAAVSTTNGALVFSAICLGFAFIHVPTVRSLAAGSVDPLRQGEALAAIEIVTSAGAVLSPIIMGSILTATINTMPLLLFYIHLVAVLMSCALLLPVRDADILEATRRVITVGGTANC